MGGKYDSSKTRVVPVFTELHSRHKNGERDIVGRLLRLGSRVRTGKVRLPDDKRWPGALIAPPSFEFASAPPVPYLRWLIQNPDREHWQRKLNAFRSGETQKRRQELLGGNRATQEAAFRHLDHSHTGKQWWVLEGITKVDCALLTKEVTVFIEGKRTEGKLTGGVEWDSRRKQVFRNLDCLAEHADTKDYYMLLVIEDPKVTEPKRTSYSRLVGQARSIDNEGWQAAQSSWRYLGDEAIMKKRFDHYLGFTTWQEIVRELNLSQQCLRTAV